MAELTLPAVGSLSHVSGGRDLWSPPRPISPPAEARHDAVVDCLREVLDPELPISLVDLGLIYGVRVGPGARAGDGHASRVEVDLTFTATGCPCMDFIREDIRHRLTQESWIESVNIHEVWDPPWTRERITPEGREQLRALGVVA
ncbi:MAG: metal-sulfur cluster assembly factor [Gemmatimonadota bacterium]